MGGGMREGVWAESGRAPWDADNVPDPPPPPKASDGKWSVELWEPLREERYSAAGRPAETEKGMGAEPPALELGQMSAEALQGRGGVWPVRNTPSLKSMSRNSSELGKPLFCLVERMRSRARREEDSCARRWAAKELSSPASAEGWAI